MSEAIPAATAAATAIAVSASALSAFTMPLVSVSVQLVIDRYGSVIIEATERTSGGTVVDKAGECKQLLSDAGEECRSYR